MVGKGILFNDIHTYYDLNLILSSSNIPPAQPKTTYVDIPGGDGSVDLTEANGEVKFYDRECDFTFTVLPGDTSTWEEKKTQVSNLLNGKIFKITLDKDEDFYYIGRCEVNNYKSDKNFNQIVVSAKVKPYKFKQNETVLTFELSEEKKTVYIINSRKTVSPIIECAGDGTVIEFSNSIYNLDAGTHKILDIRFVEGTNQMTLSGTGKITITFQEGEL